MATEHWWNDTNREETELLGGRTCLNSTFSNNKDTTWTCKGLKPCSWGERPAKNLMSHEKEFTISDVYLQVEKMSVVSNIFDVGIKRMTWRVLLYQLNKILGYTE
jgi:hypothetical protein